MPRPNLRSTFWVRAEFVFILIALTVSFGHWLLGAK